MNWLQPTSYSKMAFSLIFHEFKSFLPNTELASYGNYNILQKENCLLPAYSYKDKSIN